MENGLAQILHLLAMCDMPQKADTRAVNLNIYLKTMTAKMKMTTRGDAKWQNISAFVKRRAQKFSLSHYFTEIGAQKKRKAKKKNDDY